MLTLIILTAITSVTIIVRESLRTADRIDARHMASANKPVPKLPTPSAVPLDPYEAMREALVENIRQEQRLIETTTNHYERGNAVDRIRILTDELRALDAKHQREFAGQWADSSDP